MGCYADSIAAFAVLAPIHINNVRMCNIMKTVIKTSGIISKTIPFFGLYIRGVVRIPLLGRMLGSTNKALGRLLPNLSFLGFRKEASTKTLFGTGKFFSSSLELNTTWKKLLQSQKLYHY